MTLQDTKEGTETFVMTLRRAQVLEALSKRKWVLLKDIVRSVGVQSSTVRHVLRRFSEMGLVEKRETDRGDMYSLTEAGLEKTEDVLLFGKETKR